MQCLLEINYCCVVVLKPVWFYLQCIGINLSFPEPFCTTELDIFQIDSCDFFKRFKPRFPKKTVINADGNVSNPVFHFDSGISDRQRLKVIRIVLTVVNKMAVTALQDETIRQAVKSVSLFSLL